MQATQSRATEAAIGPYTFEEYLELARSFHSYPAPGLLVGGFMVAEAQRRMPEGVLYDAVSETSWCLPDAIQMLTPCTIGNGWMRVLDLGVYAMALFDKLSGEGVRVAIDADKLEAWPHIATWLFKTKPKREQDSPALRESIREAGASILRAEAVRMPPGFLKRRSKGAIVRCPLCGEPYPERYGPICRRCQGDAPYLDDGSAAGRPAPSLRPTPALRAVPVEESVGHAVMHDMTRIVPGASKGPEFKRGDVITPGDVCRLHQMGRFHVLLEQDCPEGFVHENDAAKAFGAAMAGPGTRVAAPPREGKAQIVADEPGLLVVRENLLEAFNMLPDVMAASRHAYSVLDKGRPVAATRAIPLFLERSIFDRAMHLLEGEPLFEIKPLRPARVGILVTGNEVFSGLIEDKFGAIVSAKVLALGCTVVDTVIAPDDTAVIARAVERMADQGCDLVVTTAGLSVDPDDVTRKGLVAAGVTDMLYGMPVLPGAMTLLARRGNMQILGVPACALFYKTTSMDLLLPRLLADVPITRRDLAKLSSGGLCLECAKCSYPKCPFGK
ncbi:MAG: trehalose-binding protein [Desulfovibrionaceae bacterium]|nr:trehalose-binding protein [Desulfovibrionaceae bacterium]